MLLHEHVIIAVNFGEYERKKIFSRSIQDFIKCKQDVTSGGINVNRRSRIFSNDIVNFNSFHLTRFRL